MNTLGWLDVTLLALVICGGVISIVQIHSESAILFGVACLLFGAVWIIFAHNYGFPVRLCIASRVASMNGTTLFGAVLGAICILVALSVYRQHPDTQQWWFWVGSCTSGIAATRLLYLYRRPRLFV